MTAAAASSACPQVSSYLVDACRKSPCACLSCLLPIIPGRLLAQEWDMPEGVTEISQRIQTLHHVSLFVCLAVGIVVFGAMFYTIFAHRRSKHPVPANFHESTKVEVIWTLIPDHAHDLIGMAVPGDADALRTRRSRTTDPYAHSDVTILITDHRFPVEMALSIR